MTAARDLSLDTLLYLDGTVVPVGDGEYWYKFEVKQVEPTPEKPHGLDYSLTLHGPNSGDPKDSRLIGFDNAHAVPGSSAPGARKKRKQWDHKHRFRTVQPYDYTDAGALIADFYAAMEAVLDERGVKR